MTAFHLDGDSSAYGLLVPGRDPAELLNSHSFRRTAYTAESLLSSLAEYLHPHFPNIRYRCAEDVPTGYCTDLYICGLLYTVAYSSALLCRGADIPDMKLSVERDGYRDTVVRLRVSSSSAPAQPAAADELQDHIASSSGFEIFRTVSSDSVTYSYRLARHADTVITVLAPVPAAMHLWVSLALRDTAATSRLLCGT